MSKSQSLVLETLIDASNPQQLAGVMAALGLDYAAVAALAALAAVAGLLVHYGAGAGHPVSRVDDFLPWNCAYRLPSESRDSIAAVKASRER